MFNSLLCYQPLAQGPEYRWMNYNMSCPFSPLHMRWGWRRSTPLHPCFGLPEASGSCVLLQPTALSFTLGAVSWCWGQSGLLFSLVRLVLTTLLCYWKGVMLKKSHSSYPGLLFIPKSLSAAACVKTEFSKTWHYWRLAQQRKNIHKHKLNMTVTVVWGTWRKGTDYPINSFLRTVLKPITSLNYEKEKKVFVIKLTPFLRNSFLSHGLILIKDCCGLVP